MPMIQARIQGMGAGAGVHPWNGDAPLNMGGVSSAKLVGQKCIGWLLSRENRPFECQYILNSDIISQLWVNVNILKSENSKIHWKLVWQAIHLVWQKTKLVGQPPHQLYRKLHPCHWRDTRYSIPFKHQPITWRPPLGEILYPPLW